MVQAVRVAEPMAKLKDRPPEFWTQLRAGLEKILPYEEMMNDSGSEYAKRYWPTKSAAAGVLSQPARSERHSG